jgi:hypothetical protein
MAKTSSLQALVRSLGISLVVEGSQFTAAGYAEAPEEQLTAACLQDGLADAIDNDFED